MRLPRIIGVTALLLGLGIGLVFLLASLLWPDPASQDPSRSQAAAGPSAVHEPAAPRKALSLNELYDEGMSKARGDHKAGNPGGPGGPGGAGAPAGSGLDDTLEEVLDADPELRKFQGLRRKALRTSAEQQDYLRMISDARLIEEARRDLLAAFTDHEIDQREELKRLQRIQYLNSALAWADNPKRAAAVDAVTAVLLAEIPAGASKSSKGSALGDKLDLFQILMLSDPDLAVQLLAKTRGTPLEKIFQLAWASGSSPRKGASQ